MADWESCDQCGPSTRAYVFVLLRNGGELAYCGSHGKQHIPALLAQGAIIDDLTAYIGAV